jgi:hypothetical protein
VLVDGVVQPKPADGETIVLPVQPGHIDVEAVVH